LVRVSRLAAPWTSSTKVTVTKKINRMTKVRFMPDLRYVECAQDNPESCFEGVDLSKRRDAFVNRAEFYDEIRNSSRHRSFSGIVSSHNLIWLGCQLRSPINVPCLALVDSQKPVRSNENDSTGKREDECNPLP
jgi:hypothetical protein